MKNPWKKIGGEWCADASELKYYNMYPDGTLVDMTQLKASLGFEDDKRVREVTSWSTFLSNGKKVTIFND